MDDKNWRKHIDPEDMTPEETYERVVELLVAGLLRLIVEEEGKKKTPAIGTATENADNTSISPAPSEAKLILESIVRERIPFGQQMGNIGRESNNAEAFWIKRIQELSGQRFSSEKIAKRLIQEDHQTKRAGR